MAKVRYLPSDFRFKADFGTYQSTPNKFTGVSVPKFVKQFTLHYKPHTRTLNQEYLAQQNGETDTKVIVIRHNAKVVEGQVAVSVRYCASESKRKLWSQPLRLSDFEKTQESWVMAYGRA